MRIPRDEPNAVGRTFIDLTPEVIAAILRTIEAGWIILRRRPDASPDLLEVPITERLRDSMRDALRGLPWGHQLVVLPGTESRSDPSLYEPDGRTDIPLLLIEVYVGQREHDPHAIIECKRVAANNATLCRQYVVEGIDRFCRGQYAANHKYGFMAGYVINGDTRGVVDVINHYLGDSRASERLQPSQIVEEEWARQSAHPRQGQTAPIDLHHAMLSFGVPATQ